MRNGLFAVTFAMLTVLHKSPHHYFIAVAQRTMSSACVVAKMNESVGVGQIARATQPTNSTAARLHRS